MSINRSYAVFGLGRYGQSVAKGLVASGVEVLGVDINENIVNSLVTEIPLCKCADVTDAEVIKQLGIANIDVVVVTMASNLEASVMAVMLCKEAGVKNIIAKCANEMHMKILSKVGADKVIFPESESGTRLARSILSSGFTDIFELSNDASMIELAVKPEWVGKSIIELNLRKKYSINIVAICQGKSVSISVDPETKLAEDMKLIVVANTSKLKKLK